MLKYRRAADGDASAFLALELAIEQPRLYAPVRTVEAAADEIRKNVLHIGTLGDVDVAAGAYRVAPDGAAYLSNISVRPDFQRRGIARAMVAFLLEQVQGARTVTLVTHPKNAVAIGLYRSFGFIVTSRKPDMFGDGEPRLVMIRDVTPGPA